MEINPLETLKEFLIQKRISFFDAVEQTIGEKVSFKIFTSDKDLKPFYFQGTPVAVQYRPLSKRNL